MSVARLKRTLEGGQMQGKLSFAVDVDGVLFERAEYPQLGKVNEEILKACKVLQGMGHKIYMYTSRRGVGLDILRVELSYLDFQFDPYDKPVAGSKIRADFYVDDRAIQPTAFMRIVESFLLGMSVQDRESKE